LLDLVVIKHIALLLLLFSISYSQEIIGEGLSVQLNSHKMDNKMTHQNTLLTQTQMCPKGFDDEQGKLKR